jgi:hypothetical protein
MSSIPYVEPMRNTTYSDSPDGESKGDLIVNNLMYRQPKALSLAKSRTHVRQFFQRSDYESAPGKTAICDWNTGSSYINVDNSYLAVTLRVKTATNQEALTFGLGSAMNIINRITIRSRSGTELERLENANLWSKIDTQYTYPQSYRDTLGGAIGMSDPATPFAPPTRKTYLSTTPTSNDNLFPVLIPLSMLCPFFRPLKKQLLPPQLASGLQIQIVFESVNTSFVNAANATDPLLDYDVVDASFLLDTVDLSDETQKALNMESADNGLEWVSPRIFTTQTSLPSGQGQVSVQMRKAVSQGTMVYSILQTSADITNGLVDSFRSRPFYLGNTWQYRVGSLFYPQQPVIESTNPLSVYPNSYFEALYAFDKPRHAYSQGSVNMRQFEENSNVFASTFSKDDNLLLSGIEINNSRVAEFNLTTESAAVDRRLTSFLEYIQVVKAFSDNTAVAI